MSIQYAVIIQFTYSLLNCSHAQHNYGQYNETFTTPHLCASHTLIMCGQGGFHLAWAGISLLA